ncbi:hypothetical protein MHBO_001340 [Bonamia ostreae]
MNSTIYDYDKVSKFVQKLSSPNIVFDFHSVDIFDPLKEKIDFVFVLRTDNEILYKRLEKRGYKQDKISENIEAEIMQVVLDEATNIFGANKIIELSSNDENEIDVNLSIVLKKINFC